MRRLLPTLIQQKIECGYPMSVLLGDIGVYSFRDIFQKHPECIENMGIMEQAMVGIAAGMAMEGRITCVHTIAPFLVERAYEQLKIDFGYQNVSGNFFSVGGTADYSALGSTHHCPADVNLIACIPNFEILVPGTYGQFETLFNQCFANDKPTYFRMSEVTNKTDFRVKYGKANTIQRGSQLTVIVTGRYLDAVLAACEGRDISVVYYSTIKPFDVEPIAGSVSSNFLIVADFFTEALETLVRNAAGSRKISINSCGPKNMFFTNYGTSEEMEAVVGVSPAQVREIIDQQTLRPGE